MSDITMCRDSKCPNNVTCYRAQAKPHQERQSYFSPQPRNVDGCLYYAPMDYTDGTSALKEQQ